MDSLALVSDTLRDFHSLPLAEVAQRVVRLARLRKDVEVALRFALELRPLGGDPRWTATEVTTLMPHASERERDTMRERVAEAWQNERLPTSKGHSLRDVSPGAPVILGGSIQEIEARVSYLTSELHRAPHPEIRQQIFAGIVDRREVLERIRQRALIYLADCEAALAPGSVSESIFARCRTRVDGHLERIAPEMRRQFASVDAAMRRDDHEALAHALTTCRRLLVAIADTVFPPRSEPVTDRQGRQRKVGAEQFVNRLIMFYEGATMRGSASQLAASTIEEFANRVRSLSDLCSKGVHARVGRSDAELAVIHSYLLAGEVLSLHAPHTPQET